MSQKSIVGYPIGLNAVQSIMQNATQSNLSFFHSAGTSSTTISTLSPSIQQILDMSSNPTCKMSISTDINSSKLEYHELREFITSITLVDSIDEPWYELGIRLNLYSKITDPGNILKILFDVKKILKHNISLSDIIIKNYQVCYSPNIIGEMYICVKDYKNILSVINMVDHISFGVSNIRNAINISGKVITNGSNFIGLLSFPDIDILNTTSNHIIQIYEALGLESARNVIYSELYNKSGDKLSSGIFADLMTKNGILQPFSKNQTFSEQKGLLLSMGMERPSYDLTRMYHTIEDDLKNSYARLTVGLKPLIGISRETSSNNIDNLDAIIDNF